MWILPGLLSSIYDSDKTRMDTVLNQLYKPYHHLQWGWSNTFLRTRWFTSPIPYLVLSSSLIKLYRNYHSVTVSVFCSATILMKSQARPRLQNSDRRELTNANFYSFLPSRFDKKSELRGRCSVQSVKKRSNRLLTKADKKIEYYYNACISKRTSRLLCSLGQHTYYLHIQLVSCQWRACALHHLIVLCNKQPVVSSWDHSM